MTPFHSPEVAAKFDAYPARARKAMLALRSLIFDVACSTPEIGEIEETLKWGEPAYVTKNKAGSTFRIDWKTTHPGKYAMYFHCQTNLVETFRMMFPNDFQFEGNRAIVFTLGESVPKDALRVCIEAALTYHVSKRRVTGGPTAKAYRGTYNAD